ncbi:hypothetical protein SDC9_112279 [bioreactor metagenome]|uniref:Uncharacterized protein n=1 Tax=bioreactor metagenome TaxID=1076179 RepID=A0A645BQ86_9ZZZZ
MQVSKCIRKLISPIQNIRFGDEAFLLLCLGHDGAQIFSGHIIHHQVITGAIGEKVRNLGQIGMVQPGQNSGLSKKLIAGFLHRLCRKGTVMLHFFESALAPFQPQVICKVNTSHTTLANDAANAVATS